MINSVLKDPWSEEDIKRGKVINCMPAWFESLKKVIPMYSEKGWVVSKHLAITSSGRHLSLNFKHPEWSKKNKNRSDPAHTKI